MRSKAALRSSRAKIEGAPVVQIFWRDDREAIGDQHAAVEAFQEIVAERTAILALATRLGFELEPAKAGTAFGTDGGARFHDPHYALRKRRFQDSGANACERAKKPARWASAGGEMEVLGLSSRRRERRPPQARRS